MAISKRFGVVASAVAGASMLLLSATANPAAAAHRSADADRKDTVIIDIDAERIASPDLWNPYVPGSSRNQGFHQAMMEIEDPSVPTGTVVQELIPGYLLAGRLLRAAMVGVSKGGPARAEVRPEAAAAAPEASNEN